ncbi:glycosyltransferase family 4 protein (plasmid) [Rhizobium ruizarguesonis]|nr:glycosyltransferase family 4 protein [Rhizobium ruizarguesonis]
MLSARYLPFAGGTETHVSEVATRLVRKGHTVTVLTGNPDGLLPAVETRDGVQIVRLKTFPRGRDWCFAPGVFRAVAEGDWDLMHVQGYHTFLAPLGMAAASRKGLPFVVTFHSGGHSSRFRSSIRRFQHRMLAPLAARAAQLIGVSRSRSGSIQPEYGNRERPVHRYPQWRAPAGSVRAATGFTSR